MSLNLCPKCGGLLETDPTQSFAGNPCTCVRESALDLTGKDRLTRRTQELTNEQTEQAAKAIIELHYNRFDRTLVDKEYFDLLQAELAKVDLAIGPLPSLDAETCEHCEGAGQVRNLWHDENDPESDPMMDCPFCSGLGVKNGRVK